MTDKVQEAAGKLRTCYDNMTCDFCGYNGWCCTYNEALDTLLSALQEKDETNTDLEGIIESNLNDWRSDVDRLNAQVEQLRKVAEAADDVLAWAERNNVAFPMLSQRLDDYRASLPHKEGEE